ACSDAVEGPASRVARERNARGQRARRSGERVAKGAEKGTAPFRRGHLTPKPTSVPDLFGGGLVSEGEQALAVDRDDREEGGDRCRAGEHADEAEDLQASEDAEEQQRSRELGL